MNLEEKAIKSVVIKVQDSDLGILSKNGWKMATSTYYMGHLDD
jgi:hypothetical protein